MTGDQNGEGKKGMSTPSSGNRLREGMLNGFLLVVTLAVGLILIDWLSTFFIDSRSPFERMFPVEQTRHPEPFIMFKGKPGGGHNDLGYRGKSPTQARPGSYRIFFLGGSTAYDGEPPIAELVEQRFHEMGAKNVEVFNFGVVSSNSGMELARVVHEILDYKPDYVIFFNGGNDLISPLGWDPRPGYPFNFMAYEKNPLMETRRQYSLAKSIALGSNLFRIAAGRYPSLNEWLLGQKVLRKKSGFETAPWKEKIATAYLGNAMKAQTALSGADARFAVFFQPLIYYKDHLGAKEKPLCAEQGRAYYEETRAMIRSMRQERFPSLNFFDVSDIYDTERGDVFTDIIHTTQEGRTAMAVTICDRIAADALRDMKRKGK
ncbi:MAG TPA: SGNH/GDSL hydrolase family protein [Syntrophales bacterium]|nr:SGNH/GDSL hydrolase family protein [Syntrophales bacterium]